MINENISIEVLWAMPESLGVLGVDCCEYFFLVFISVMVYGVMGLWGLLGSIRAQKLSSTAMGAACGQGWMRWGGLLRYC